MSWLFEEFSTRESGRMESALASCTTLSLPAGVPLEDHRVAVASLIVVEEGLVVVASTGEASERRMVVALRGARSLLLPPAQTERVEALSDAHLTIVPESALAALLEVPAVAAALIEALAAGLRDCQDSLSHFSEARHIGRIRSKLVQLGRTHGRAAAGGLWLSLPLTHEVLAEMVGSTRETVTRAMSKLSRDGFVDHERGAYRLAVPPREDFAA